MKPIKSKTVVFITGAFAGHHTWDKWISYYEGRGYNCTAPPWPYKSASPQVLRNKHPHDTSLANTSLSQVLEYYLHIIEQQPERPIVIGHAMGGLIVQLLLQRNILAAGIALHSMPPRGIYTFKPSFLWSILKVTGVFSSNSKSHLISFKEWKYAYTNGAPYEEQKYSYEKDVVPLSKRVFKDCFTKNAKVNFSTPRQPLLILSGTTDRITSTALNYNNYLMYNKNNSSVTDYKEFKNKNHFSYGLCSWKEEADYILDWLDIISNPAIV